MTDGTCKHAALYWHPAPANERGWKCTAYGLVDRRPCPDNYKLLQYRRKS